MTLTSSDISCDYLEVIATRGNVKKINEKKKHHYINKVTDFSGFVGSIYSNLSTQLKKIYITGGAFLDT